MFRNFVMCGQSTAPAANQFVSSTVMSSPAFGDDSAPLDGFELSVQGFCERIALLSELELPCVIHVASNDAEQIRRGVIRRFERTVNRLNLYGDDFALYLHIRNIGSIRLISAPTADRRQPSAVEIRNFGGRIITRIIGIEGGVGAAVWADVMGNPCLTTP